MAKNKNRKQGGQQTRASQSEQATQQAKSQSTEAVSELKSHTAGSPADLARKQQRRFGHN
ncbi:hypothetical protein ACWCP6_17275 [Streptomyces sp. NPDC002004]